MTCHVTNQINQHMAERDADLELEALRDKCDELEGFLADAAATRDALKVDEHGNKHPMEAGCREGEYQRLLAERDRLQSTVAALERERDELARDFDASLTVIRDYNDTLARQVEWKPIESAPTNQSVLIFIENEEHYGPGIYRGMQVDMGTGRRWMVCGLHMGRDCGAHNQPTHWMPLPAAPAALASPHWPNRRRAESERCSI